MRRNICSGGGGVKFVASVEDSRTAMRATYRHCIISLVYKSLLALAWLSSMIHSEVCWLTVNILLRESRYYSDRTSSFNDVWRNERQQRAMDAVESKWTKTNGG